MPDLGNTSVFSQTDASNNTGTAPSWNGSAAPSTLDDAGRALQGAIFREWNWRNFTQTATGTANAKALTYTVSPAAYYNGQEFAFINNLVNTSAVTLAVNSLGSKSLKKDVAGVLTALSSGDMGTSQFVKCSYNSTNDCFVWTNWQGAATTASTTTQQLTGTATTVFSTPDSIAALWEKGADTASAGTVSFGEGGLFHVTGTTTITDLDFATATNGRAVDVVFDGILILTHNATTLQLPGGANITTAAGDRARFVQDSSDNVICLYYTRANGQPLVGGLTLGTAQATTSGTSVDFTGIPAGTKRITIMLAGVSTNGTSPILIQIGDSGGVETSGYVSQVALTGAAGSFGSSTAGFVLTTTDVQTAANTFIGTITLNHFGSNIWIANGDIGDTVNSLVSGVTGSKTLTGELDRFRITTAGGVNTFDLGSSNYHVES
jgi:hypothetical protein